MNSTQFWVGMLVPPFLKWVNPYLKRFFKLTEFDQSTRGRVFAKNYPVYFSFLYVIWALCLLAPGFFVLMWLMISGPSLFPDKNYAVPVFLGLINMIGVWFLGGAILDFLFWQISPNNFKDYIIMRQIKSGWGYLIDQQISTLFKIGIVYYLISVPVIILLLVI